MAQSILAKLVYVNQTAAQANIQRAHQRIALRLHYDPFRLRLPEPARPLALIDSLGLNKSL